MRHSSPLAQGSNRGAVVVPRFSSGSRSGYGLVNHPIWEEMSASPGLVPCCTTDRANQMEMPLAADLVSVGFLTYVPEVVLLSRAEKCLRPSGSAADIAADGDSVATGFEFEGRGHPPHRGCPNSFRLHGTTITAFYSQGTGFYQI
jgi:hypothetical protein